MSSKSKQWAKNTKYNHEHYRNIQLEPDVTVSSLTLLMDSKLSGQCIYCGKTLSFENEFNYQPSLDIINPKEPVTMDNLQIICRKCNTLKAQMNHSTFVRFRGTPKYLKQVKCFNGSYPTKITGRIY